MHDSRIIESPKQALEIINLIFARSFCSRLHLHALTPPFASPTLQLVPPLMLLIKPFLQHQKQQKGFKFILSFALKAKARRISIKK